MTTNRRFELRNTRSAKLTAGTVLQIRDLYSQGWTQGALAREFGISVNQIGRIVRGESWTGLPLHPTGEADATLERLKQVQQERDAAERMEKSVAFERELQQIGDSAVEELKIDPAAQERARKLKGEG